MNDEYACKDCSETFNYGQMRTHAMNTDHELVFNE